MISASQIYDFVHCPHRVYMDEFGDSDKRDETSPFVELLWEQGLVHEGAVAAGLKITANLKSIGTADRERKTLSAMARREPLIYGGRLTTGDLVGEPDLLEWTDLGYVPGDIKSGSGFEGDESEGKLKKQYAFQLAHYVAILEQLVACPHFPHTNNTQLAAAAAVGKWETPWAFSKQAKPASFPPLACAANSAGVM